MRAAPAVSRAKDRKRRRTRAYRFSGEHPTFPAQWLYGLYALSPVSYALLPPSPCEPVRKLGASLAAPGPHDFAVRFDTARLAPPPRPPHPIPTFGDDGQRPFPGDRMAGVITVIWVSGKAKFYPTGYYV